MIPVLIAVAEFIGIIILVVYSLADNERIYASIFSAIIGSILSFILGYQLLFGLIEGEKYLDVAAVTYQDHPLGYFFIMVGIGIAIMSFAIVVDAVLKGKEKKARGLS